MFKSRTIKPNPIASRKLNVLGVLGKQRTVTIFLYRVDCTWNSKSAVISVNKGGLLRVPLSNRGQGDFFLYGGSYIYISSFSPIREVK